MCTNMYMFSSQFDVMYMYMYMDMILISPLMKHPPNAA